jgi:hypothetical protein
LIIRLSSTYRTIACSFSGNWLTASNLGPAASVGKVVGGAVSAEIGNGTYQWFDLSKPGNENKSWDY